MKKQIPYTLHKQRVYTVYTKEWFDNTICIIKDIPY